MRAWLENTHGTGFELLRHLLLRFFDSELVTASGQTAPAIAGANHLSVHRMLSLRLCERSSPPRCENHSHIPFRPPPRVNRRSIPLTRAPQRKATGASQRNKYSSGHRGVVFLRFLCGSASPRRRLPLRGTAPPHHGRPARLWRRPPSLYRLTLLQVVLAFSVSAL